MIIICYRNTSRNWIYVFANKFLAKHLDPALLLRVCVYFDELRRL
jgi:hypothetical protein